MEKLTTAQYKFICELLWGGVPIDRQWAEGSKLFTVNAPLLLQEYPMLDKSFFEKYNTNNQKI